MRALAWIIVTSSVLVGCQAETAQQPDEPVIRAVHAIAAEPVATTQTRSFPAVLEPRQITPLAFEVGGRVGLVDLTIGQEVAEGEPLLSVDSTDFQLRLESAEATVREAEAALADARDEAARQQQLFDRNVVAQAARDRAATGAEQAEARAQQARRNLDLVRESRADTQLLAPFDGIINSVDVQSYTNVQAGRSVLTLYPDKGLQASILVSYDIVTGLSLGDEAAVTIADDKSLVLAGAVAEIARRAPAVSSFPVIVALRQDAPHLRPGMAVDVSLTLAERGETGTFKLPLSSLARNRMTDIALDGEVRQAVLLVVDPDESVIAERQVSVRGMNGSNMIVTDGLEAGERVVVAGVPFLHPGQKVRLWQEGD